MDQSGGILLSDMVQLLVLSQVLCSRDDKSLLEIIFGLIEEYYAFAPTLVGCVDPFRHGGTGRATTPRDFKQQRTQRAQRKTEHVNCGE